MFVSLSVEYVDYVCGLLALIDFLWFRLPTVFILINLLSYFKNTFINIWFAIRRLNKYILYSKVTQATQDTNLSSYVPKVNVDHTISDQGTGISTLDHSATT